MHRILCLFWTGNATVNATARNGFTLPPSPRNDAGDYRRVGFELEFSGVTMEQAVAALADSLGAKTREQSVAETLLEVEDLGEFNVELDWAYLKRKAAESGDEKSDDEWLELLSQAAALLVPVEVVCPPIPLDRLDALEPMIESLREAGAVGTDESLIAAYGVHINTEIPGLDADTLFAYLRAFALLQWWLVDAHQVDAARRLSPYIDLYPEAYLRKVLERDTASIDEIFDDYLEHNATRNRALDLLPLLAEIDEARVQRAVDDPRVKPRPAFHYRLQDCHIEKSDWSLTEAWGTWLEVERLAADGDALDALAAKFRDAHRPVIGVKRRDWVETIEQWHRDHASG